jgi:hypothetical protein
MMRVNRMVTKPKQKPKPKPKQPAHSGAAIHTWIITAGVLTGILIATAALGFSYYSWNAGPPQTGKLSISAIEKCRLEYRSGTEQHSAFAQSIPRIDLCWDLTINNIGPTRITLVEMTDQTKSFDSDIGGHVDLDYHAGLHDPRRGSSSTR